MTSKAKGIIANTFVKKLEEKGLTAAFAESMTCGMAAHKLASFKGTSEVLKGSVVCYTAGAKRELLNVSDAKIEKFTCESSEVTEEMVRNLSMKIEADIYAAITGLASEGGSESKEKPVGTVFFAVAFKSKIYNERKLFRGTALEIKKKACDHLYKMVLKIIDFGSN